MSRSSLEQHRDIVFDAKRDSPEAIAERLRNRGIAYVKNVIDRDLAAYCSRAITANARALKEMIGKDVNDMPLCFADRAMADGSRHPTLFGNSLDEFKDPLSFSGMDRSWYYEGPRNYKLWFWRNGGRFPNLLLRAALDSILPSVYAAYFGDKSFTSYEANAVRYQRADIQHMSYFFHQDGNYQSRDPTDHVGLTTWVPFIDAGKDAPGLQFHPYKVHDLLPLPEGIEPPYLFADEAYCLERFGDTLWAPEILAGDTVIFDNFCVHRTYMTPAMKGERQSADLRIFPVRAAPKFVNQWGSWELEFSPRFTGSTRDEHLSHAQQAQSARLG